MLDMWTAYLKIKLIPLLPPPKKKKQQKQNENTERTKVCMKETNSSCSQCVVADY